MIDDSLRSALLSSMKILADVQPAQPSNGDRLTGIFLMAFLFFIHTSRKLRSNTDIVVFPLFLPANLSDVWNYVIPNRSPSFIRFCGYSAGRVIGHRCRGGFLKT